MSDSAASGRRRSSETRAIPLARREAANYASSSPPHTPATREAKARDSQTVDYLDMVMGLWMHSARKDMRRARRMKKEKNRESVQKWRQAVA